MRIFSHAVGQRRSKYIAMSIRVLLIVTGLLMLPSGFASAENNGVNYGDPMAVIHFLVME